MRGPILVAASATGSALAHLAALAFLTFSVDPNTVPAQPTPTTRLTVDTYQVDQQDAQAQPTDGDAASVRAPRGAAIDAGALERLHLAPQRPPGRAVNVDRVPLARLQPRPTIGKTVKISVPAKTIVSETAQLAAIHLDQTTPASETIAIRPAAPTKLVTLTVSPAASPTLSVSGNSARTSSTKGDALQEQHLAALATQAILAWDFGDRTVTDPTSLAVIQAFLAPGDLTQSDANSGEVRDGLTATLASVDCARLTATFIQETGALEVRGHVPDNAARAPILAALQSQIGDGITVTDNLLYLPRPQCGALTGIADIGLPQSTDQFTNTRLIGENAHAREYGFVEGQRLSFDLTAPDYDAVVYVDYFDAAGQVIHLVPNDTVPLTLHPAKTAFGVGIDNGDRRSLNITIGPPFGQEITVAFAASVPLFDNPRPIIEPAEPYLEFLKARIADARRESLDFKGEWVYFLVTTAPATQ